MIESPFFPVEISVIMPAFNAAQTILLQISAIFRQSCSRPYELIVVDDASTDQTVAIATRAATEHTGRMTVISNERRKGPNASRNAGADKSVGQYLLFCDADDIVAEGWVEALYCGLITADLTGGYLEEELLNGDAAVRARSPASVPAGFDAPLNGLPRPPFSNAGCRKSCWKQLGGANPAYWRNTDTEFFWRAQLAGHRLVYRADAVVHYRHRVGVRGNSNQAFLTAKFVCRLYFDFRRVIRLSPSPFTLFLRECRWVVASLFRARVQRRREQMARRLGALAGYFVGLVGGLISKQIRKVEPLKHAKTT